MDATQWRQFRTGVEIVVMTGGGHATIWAVGEFYLRNCTLFGFTVSDATVEALSIYAAYINDWLARKAPRAKIALRLPLSEAARAHQLTEARTLFGKIVLQP